MKRLIAVLVVVGSCAFAMPPEPKCPDAQMPAGAAERYRLAILETEMRRLEAEIAAKEKIQSCVWRPAKSDLEKALDRGSGTPKG